MNINNTSNKLVCPDHEILKFNTKESNSSMQQVKSIHWGLNFQRCINGTFANGMVIDLRADDWKSASTNSWRNSETLDDNIPTSQRRDLLLLWMTCFLTTAHAQSRVVPGKHSHRIFLPSWRQIGHVTKWQDQNPILQEFTLPGLRTLRSYSVNPWQLKYTSSSLKAHRKLQGTFCGTSI